MKVKKNVMWYSRLNRGLRDEVERWEVKQSDKVEDKISYFARRWNIKHNSRKFQGRFS